MAALKPWKASWILYFQSKNSLLINQANKCEFRVPYYYPVKLVFFLWLQLPQFRGAGVLYNQYIKPVLEKYKPKIEIILEHLKKSVRLGAQLSGLMCLFDAGMGH